MVRAFVEGESERDRAGNARRALQSVPAAHLLVDLVQDGDFADVVVADGRVVMAERAARHQTEEEHAGLIVEPGRHMKIRQSRAEQIVNVRDAVQNGIGVDALRAVQQRHDEGHDAIVCQHPAADDECAAIAEKSGVDDVERRTGAGIGVKYAADPLQDFFRICLQVR